MKDQKGVTLIALVITIIVLIILAAVSIAALTGDNGILTNADKAKSDNAKSATVEKINTELEAMRADLYVDNTVSYATMAGAHASLSGYTIKVGDHQISDSDVENKAAYTTATTGDSKTIDFSTGTITISKDGYTGTIALGTPAEGKSKYEMTPAVK
jgi:Tfp pilus assembly protein PilE